MTQTQLSIDGPPPASPLQRAGYCLCLCGARVPKGSQYLTPAHRQRAYRKRVKAEMERVGLPPSPSLKAAGVSRPATPRNGDARTGGNVSLRRRSGLQVSYRKAVETLHVELGASKLAIELALEQALPARQRQVLEKRDAA